jgi:hypothetical protein
MKMVGWLIYTPTSALKVEKVCFSETMVSTYESIWRHNPEAQRRHLHRRENLKSHDCNYDARLTSEYV